MYAAVVALVLLFVLVAGFFPLTISSMQPGPLLRASQVSLPGTAGAAGWARPAAPSASTLQAIEPPLINPPLLSPQGDSQSPAQSATDASGTVVTSDVDIAALARTAAVAVPASAVLPEREPASRPLFFRYEVQQGDTVGGIADRFGIASNYILWNNIDIIADANFLQIGQQLQVPSVAGIIHGVRVGETLYEIADRYDASVGDIINANKLSADGFIRAGATILVPGGRMIVVAAPRIVPTPTPQPVRAAAAAPVATAAPVPTAAPVAPVPTAVSSYNFVWPTVDIITSYFGRSHPLGIDIRAPVGTPIKAAADGKVIFVGGIRCCSYGLYVEVRHDGGFTSLYGHLRGFAVENGDEVKAGQVLGFAGLTGRTTGPHLHFEIELNGVRRNPHLYLP